MQTGVKQRIRNEYAVIKNHANITTIAGMYGMTVTELKHTVTELDAHNKPPTIRWGTFGEDAARLLFEAFTSSRLNITRFSAKYGYPKQSITALFNERWPDEYQQKVVASKLKTSTSTQGANLERKLRDILTAAGYWVMRSPASKGAADLVALRDGEILLVQAKRSGALPPTEWNNLLQLAHRTGGTPILASNPYPGCLIWEQLLTPKTGRGTGEKTLFEITQHSMDAERFNTYTAIFAN